MGWFHDRYCRRRMREDQQALAESLLRNDGEPEGLKLAAVITQGLDLPSKAEVLTVALSVQLGNPTRAFEFLDLVRRYRITDRVQFTLGLDHHFFLARHKKPQRPDMLMQFLGVPTEARPNLIQTANTLVATASDLVFPRDDQQPSDVSNKRVFDGLVMADLATRIEPMHPLGWHHLAIYAATGFRFPGDDRDHIAEADRYVKFAIVSGAYDSEETVRKMLQAVTRARENVARVKIAGA